MPETACALQRQVAPAGDPSPQTCLQVARQAAILAVTTADDAMTAVCHSRAGATARLEAVMHAVHKEAVEAEKWADRAEEYADDPTMPTGALLYCAREAVDHAVRAQLAAGVETVATSLRAELERKLTAAEYAARETERRREEAERETEERAATGMDADNRDRAARNRYLAERHVAELGWTVGHVRVLEAAESGRLYWRDGRTRQAARHGVWNGGRRISRERTEALFAARFLVAVRQEDGTRLLTPTPMGQTALELARLHPAGLHPSDRGAYEARFARVRRRHKRRDDQKAAARVLP
ncbi:DNA cytosine methyltransferase, partial [Streptomyces hundungensis]